MIPERNKKPIDVRTPMPSVEAVPAAGPDSLYAWKRDSDAAYSSNTAELGSADSQTGTRFDCGKPCSSMLTAAAAVRPHRRLLKAR